MQSNYYDLVKHYSVDHDYHLVEHWSVDHDYDPVEIYYSVEHYSVGWLRIITTGAGEKIASKYDRKSVMKNIVTKLRENKICR